MLSDGQVLNSRYKIIRQLKKGGMGAVYEASDMILNARVAIKENLLEDENLRVPFRREAQLLANLHHPSLPHCSDLFSVENQQYLVMEFIEGDDLATLLSKQEQPLPVETVMDWAKQLLDVLEYLHSQPTLHRDIKPLNIKVRNGCVYLLDFGLAYGQSGDMSTAVRNQFNWNYCSLRYSPLEQIRCERTVPASDLYSLAATLYMLLTQNPPNNAEHRLQMILAGEGDPLKDIRFHKPSLDKKVSYTIMHALALNIDQRPSSAAEMRRMMFTEKVSEPEVKVPQIEVEVPQLEVKVSQSKTKGTRKFLMAGGLAGAVLVGTLLGMLHSNLKMPLFQHSLHSFLTQALSSVMRAVNLDDTGTPVEQAIRLTNEAEKLLQGAEYEAARKKAEAALALDPNNPYAHFIYGDTLWDNKGETADSIAQLPEVLEQADIILKLVSSPQSNKEYIARAWANLVKGKFERAIADATTALDSQGDSVPALMIRASAKAANAEVDSKNAIESLGDYDQVLRLMPHYAQAYANRAATYYALGHLKLALSDFTEAVRLTPRASFLYKLGYVDFNLQEFAEARSNFQKALQKNPNYHQAYIGLGDVYFQEEDWNNSIQNYSLANRISPTHYAFNQLGSAYIYLEQFEKSVENYQKALELDPNDYKSQNGLAFSYASLKNFEGAIDSYTKALELAPKENRESLALIYKFRAQAFRQSGQESLAENDEKLARELEL